MSWLSNKGSLVATWPCHMMHAVCVLCMQSDQPERGRSCQIVAVSVVCNTSLPTGGGNALTNRWRCLYIWQSTCELVVCGRRKSRSPAPGSRMAWSRVPSMRSSLSHGWAVGLAWCRTLPGGPPSTTAGLAARCLNTHSVQVMPEYLHSGSCAFTDAAHVDLPAVFPAWPGSVLRSQ